MFDDLTWTCHVCGKTRPDAKISVFRHSRKLNGIDMFENVRYCNDNPSCIEGAKTFHHIPVED